MSIHPYTRLFSKTIDPTITDDSAAGYEVGDIWVTSAKSWQCLDASAGAAIWLDLTAGGGGGWVPTATSDLNMASYDINNIDTANFILTPGGTLAEGSLQWAADDETLQIGLHGAVALQIGQETLILVKNQTGSTLSNGKVAVYDGAIGASGRMKAKYGIADGTMSGKLFIGVITEDILDGNDGFVTMFGKVRGISTDGSAYGETWVAGDILYASDTVSGGLTKTLPVAPHLNLPIAVVITAHATTGTLFVRMTNGLTLNELHDTNVPTPTNKYVLAWNNSSLRWEDQNLGVTNGDSHDHDGGDGGAIPSTSITVSKVGSPTIDTLAEDITTRGSSGVIDGTISYIQQDTGTFKIKVLAGEGYIRTSNDQQAELKVITWSEVTQIDIPAPATGYETLRFIGIEYNAGSPRVTVRTSFNWNWYDEFPLGRVSLDALGVMHILNAYAHTEDTANLTRKWMRLNFPFHREEPPEGSGGIIIGETGTRNLTLTAGYIWHGYNRYFVPARNTGTGDTFDLLYRRAGGGYTGTAGNTQWPNTQYDDGSGTLVTMTTGRYACIWIYLDVAEEGGGVPGFDVIYGRGQYTTLPFAQAETAPSPLPEHLTYHGRLLARLIFQKSASTASLIESAWTTSLGTATVSDHNQLSNLQGGTTGEYYHLTSAEYTGKLVTNGNTHDHSGGDGAQIDYLGLSNLPSIPTQEQIEDYVGAMATGGTQNGIAVTYNDAGGVLNFDTVTFNDARYTVFDGWIADANTWSYSSADSPTFVISVNADMTGKITVGDRIKLNQSGNKYFIVTVVGAYGGGATLITVYGGTDYTLANSAISSPYYSHMKCPVGFNPSPLKWSVEATNTSNNAQATPVGGTIYNPGSISLSVPIGAWYLSYNSVTWVDVSVAGQYSVQGGLGTTSSTLDAELKYYFVAYGSTVIGHGGGGSKAILLASKQTYYLNCTTGSLSNVTNIRIRGDISTSVIRAVSAYL